MPVTYWSYLKIEELLALQEPVSDGPEHDEMLFIVIHQVYELWFKELLHESDYLCRRLLANENPAALGTLKRILTILKVLVSQIDVLETMTPLNFLSFRDRLESGSGFQSWQFRELEFVMGRKDSNALDRYPEGHAGRAALRRRMGAPTLWDAFLHFLGHNGYRLADDITERDVTKPIVQSVTIQEVLLTVYRTNPELTQVCERLVDLDEGMQEWRYRHVKMVQRTIGTRGGTGGSSGAEYLMRTLNQPAFPDLWAIRTAL
ncbi:MAG: tryptophan 2,3-dioxygenase family protein [Gemmatimonadales bacterium]